LLSQEPCRQARGRTQAKGDGLTGLEEHHAHTLSCLAVMG